MQPNQSLPEIPASEYSSGYTSWEGFDILSDPDFGHGGWKCSNELDDATMPRYFCDTESAPKPSALQSDPIPVKAMPTQVFETNMSSNGFYYQDETQMMPDAFDLDYSFDNETTLSDILGGLTTKPILFL